MFSRVFGVCHEPTREHEVAGRYCPGVVITNKRLTLDSLGLIRLYVCTFHYLEFIGEHCKRGYTPPPLSVVGGGWSVPLAFFYLNISEGVRGKVAFL